MNETFINNYEGPIAQDIVQPKIPPNVPITIPPFFSKWSTLYCMLTLDWDPWGFSSEHTIPFPVNSRPRPIGRNRQGNMVYEKWAFSRLDPTGTPIPHDEVVAPSQTADPYSPYSGGSGSNRTNDNGIPTGTIIAAATGGAAGVVFFFMVICWCKDKRRRRRRRRVDGTRNERIVGFVQETVESRPTRSSEPIRGNFPTLAPPRLTPPSFEPPSIEPPPPTYEEATKRV